MRKVKEDKSPLRDEPKNRDAERKQTEGVPSKPQASGQTVCDSTGCCPVAKGCHAEFVYTQGFGISNMTREVCNQISGCQTLSERQIGSTSAIALARSR